MVKKVSLSHPRPIKLKALDTILLLNDNKSDPRENGILWHVIVKKCVLLLNWLNQGLEF